MKDTSVLEVFDFDISVQSQLGVEGFSGVGFDGDLVVNLDFLGKVDGEFFLSGQS